MGTVDTFQSIPCLHLPIIMSSIQSWANVNVAQLRTSAITVVAVTDDLVAIQRDGLPASESSSRLGRVGRHTSTVAVACSSRTTALSSSVMQPSSRSSCFLHPRRRIDQTASSGLSTRRPHRRRRDAWYVCDLHQCIMSQ